MSGYPNRAFALIYLRRQLTDSQGQITFSEFHADSLEWALSWIGPQGVRANRRAWIAPRGGGKSTFHFRILPMWALAFGHKTYFAIFTRVSTLAEEHSQAMRLQLRTNPLLRQDFPDLCKPRFSQGRAVHDTMDTYLAASGAVFTAKGMDSSVLGSSIDERRADVIVLDDVEDSEANYSPYQASKRLKTITGAIGYYNVNAVWSWVGTTTMHGGLIHQLKRTLSDNPVDVGDPELEWVSEQRITVRYYPALETGEDGELRSSWPARWATEDLIPLAHTRDFLMHMQNEPSLGDEGMWQDQDITHVEQASESQGRAILAIDGAVTTTRDSDFTGLCITQFLWPTPEQQRQQQPGTVEVLYSTKIKLTGRRLRDRVMQLLDSYPQVRRVIVEENQGGDLWRDVLSDLPVEIELVHASAAKEVRAAWALAHYQARPTRVVHVGRHHHLEGTMKAFPLVAHDDDLDAMVYAVNYWLSPTQVRKPGAGLLRGMAAERVGSSAA